MDALSGLLKSQLIERSFPGSVLPEITYDRDNQDILDVMTSIVNNNDIILIVTAPHDGQDIATYMFSDHCRQIMHWAPVPVMIAPESTPIRNPEKIAITTSLGQGDTSYIICGQFTFFHGYAKFMVSKFPFQTHHYSNKALLDNWYTLEQGRYIL